MARCEVADVSHGLGDQGPTVRDPLVLEQRLLAHEGADVQHAFAQVDHVEAGDAVDVDEDVRLGRAELHQRYEALAAGEHPHVGCPVQQEHCVLDRRRRVVGERRRLHRSTFPR